MKPDQAALAAQLERLFLHSGQVFHEMNAQAEYPPAASRTVTDLPAHFAGACTLALELVNEAGLVKAALVDFDGGTAHWPALQRLLAGLQELGLPSPPVSVSGGKGYGVWLLFAELLPVPQVQQFLRLLRAAYFPEIDQAHHDLRPDIAGASAAERISGKAVAKFPPCQHRKSGQWSAFIEPGADAPPVGLPTPPDLAQQAALLARVQAIPAAAFLRALAVLQQRVGGAGWQAEAPHYFPHFGNMESGKHPPCIVALLDKGAPHGMDYNTANLNLAAYAAARGLDQGAAEALARTMAAASEDHPTGKRGIEQKLRNFRSNREPRPFACDYARNTATWRDHYGGLTACANCPANPGMGSDKSASRTANKTRLEGAVARELLAWAWAKGEALPQIRHVWPSVAIELGDGGEAFLPVYAIAAQALPQATAAAFFAELDKHLSEKRFSDADPIRAYAERFLETLREKQPTEAEGRAALARALHLERRAGLAAAVQGALAHGPEVAANTVALKLREAAEATLRQEETGGPLVRLRRELFEGLARAADDTVPTPFPRLTGLLHGGFRAGRLYALAAPPKAGKTTFAAVCLDQAAASGHPALYVGYEMGREQMVEYAVARRVGINSRKIETRHLDAAQAERVAASLEGYLANEGRFLDLWEAGLTTSIGDIAAWVTRKKAQHPGKTPLVVIDYLQLARTGIREIDAHQSETKRVTEVAVACKDLARQTGAAVIALSSVTKAAEVASKQDGEIDVTAFRDSLAIIHAADGVLTLQTDPVRVTEGKNDSATERVVEPWAWLAERARREMREQDAVMLERWLQNRGKDYPQGGPGAATRARVSLVRHRGSTGEVALYYRRAFHQLEEVALPGLEALEPSGVDTESAKAVFRKYAEAAQEAGVEQGGFDGFDIPQPEGQEAEAGGVPEVAYRYLTDLAEAKAAIAGLRGLVGLDLETTGLSPVADQARLLSLSDGMGDALVIDCRAIGGLHQLKAELLGLRAVAHNAVFDMGFLWRAGVRLNLECSLLACHVLTGTRAKLVELAERYCELHLDKGLQVSNWSAPVLTPEQLAYAALDAVAVRALFPKLEEELAERESERAYRLARDAQPAIVRMELAGMPFDAAQQAQLLEGLQQQREQLALTLAEALNGANPNSGPQLSAWITEKLGGPETEKYKAWPKTPKGQLCTGADDLKKGLLYLPEEAASLVRDALLPFKDAEKKLSAFGTSLSAHISPVDGRIHADFSLAGTVTGRMSCSAPNLQQIPRAAEFRALFRAPEERAFVIADYGAMELRVAAQIVGEEALLQAFRDGQDAHRLTAARLLDKAPEAVTKEERQMAKAVNFGLLYGQGARGLQAYAASTYGVELSEEKARQLREAWFEAYPAFREWHRRLGSEAMRALAVRTPAGRERRWPSSKEFRVTEAYNTPVQGGAAEAMLAALASLDQQLAGLDAEPVAVIHDEVIVEAAAGDAEAVRERLVASMAQGMRAIFPEAPLAGLVEAHVGQSWAEK